MWVSSLPGTEGPYTVSSLDLAYNLSIAYIWPGGLGFLRFPHPSPPSGPPAEISVASRSIRLLPLAHVLHPPRIADR